MAISHQVDPSHLKMTTIVQKDVRGGLTKPLERPKREHGTQALPGVHSSRPLQVMNALSELIYH